jgi:hypothetical protein
MALHPDVLAEIEAASAARKRKDAELPCAAIERRRAEHVRLREAAIANMLTPNSKKVMLRTWRSWRWPVLSRRPTARH